MVKHIILWKLRSELSKEQKKEVALAIKAGLQPGFKVSAEVEGKSGSTKASVDLDNVKSFNLAVPFGLSYDFGRLVLDARYTVGLTKAFDDSYLDSKNITFQLGIGYKFSL